MPVDFLVADVGTLTAGAVAVVSSAIASVCGFGIGSLLTPCLAAQLDMPTAVAVVSIPHFAATLMRFWMLRQHVDRQVLLTFGVASFLGGAAGALVCCLIAGSQLLTLILSLLLILSGSLAAAGASEKFVLPGKAGLVAGALSGIFGGLVGNQGGIRSAALLSFSLSKEAFVATATATGVMVDLARLPVYLYFDAAVLERQAMLIGLLTACCIGGTFLGRSFLSSIPPALFKRVVGLLILVLGLFLCWRTTQFH